MDAKLLPLKGHFKQRLMRVNVTLRIAAKSKLREKTPDADLDAPPRRMTAEERQWAEWRDGA